MAEIFPYRRALPSSDGGIINETGDALSKKVNQMHAILEATASKPTEDDVINGTRQLQVKTVNQQLKQAREQNRNDLVQFRENCENVSKKQDVARTILYENNRQIQEAIIIVREAEDLVRKREYEVKVLQDEKAELEAHIEFLKHERSQIYAVDQQKISLVQDLQARALLFQKDADVNSNTDHMNQLEHRSRESRKIVRKTAATMLLDAQKGPEFRASQKKVPLPELYRCKRKNIMEQITFLEILTGVLTRESSDNTYLDRIESQLDGIIYFLSKEYSQDSDTICNNFASYMKNTYWKNRT